MPSDMVPAAGAEQSSVARDAALWDDAAHFRNVASSPAYPASWPLSSARAIASRSQIFPRAVAGFADADLSIETKENKLTIRGEK